MTQQSWKNVAIFMLIFTDLVTYSSSYSFFIFIQHIPNFINKKLNLVQSKDYFKVFHEVLTLWWIMEEIIFL